MTSTRISGTEGYAEATDALVEQWQEISFADSHRPVLHLIPTVPGTVLDIGAGIGVDAAAFAAMGHRVVAVEPTDAFRKAGMARNPSAAIEWLDDSLPDLALLMTGSEKFDLVMLTGVWMHLDEAPRRQAMPRVASLVREGGLMIMSLRHGLVPAGRRMFEVSGDETIALARAQRLDLVLNLRTESIQAANRHAGVTWTWLAFAKGSDIP